MKTSHPVQVYYPALFLALSLSCVQDDNFSTPELELTTTVPSGTEISIASVKSALLQEIENNGNNLLKFDSELYVSGFVISSDQDGNFFEELIIQNDTVAGDQGLKVLIDSNPIYQYFEWGRKVYVNLKGLTVGLSSGQIALGFRDGNRLGQIAESRLFDFVLRDTLVATIKPGIKQISELNADMINTYIRLEGMQFNRNEALGDTPLTFAGEPEDQFDGERILESCLENTSIVLSTSVFADFSHVTLPSGSGYVDGIFTYNFFGDEYNIVLNDLDGIQLNSPERCDPLEVDCGIAKVVGTHVIFSEFFETQTTGDPISGNGWTNYAESGTQLWEAYFDDGTNASLGISARIGSFMSGDDSSIGWLITPQIDFDIRDGETLRFKTSNSFADGSTLELLFSSDWDGDPENVVNATWDLLSSAILVEDDDFFGDWISSGNVDMSCISGTGYVAWKYMGSGEADFDGTYELDDIEILSN
jgi:hypothetical protein